MPITLKLGKKGSPPSNVDQGIKLEEFAIALSFSSGKDIRTIDSVLTSCSGSCSPNDVAESKSEDSPATVYDLLSNFENEGEKAFSGRLVITRDDKKIEFTFKEMEAVHMSLLENENGQVQFHPSLAADKIQLGTSALLSTVSKPQVGDA